MRILTPSSSETDHLHFVQAQEISLNFHCKCEQFVHFASGSFFNFNGTAGESSQDIVTVNAASISEPSSCCA